MLISALEPKSLKKNIYSHTSTGGPAYHASAYKLPPSASLWAQRRTRDSSGRKKALWKVGNLKSRISRNTAKCWGRGILVSALNNDYWIAKTGCYYLAKILSV